MVDPCVCVKITKNCVNKSQNDMMPSVYSYYVGFMCHKGRYRDISRYKEG